MGLILGKRVAADQTGENPAKKESPLDYAVIQGKEDFSKDLSEEQIKAIGEGKVPIHREGKYRSPFAHPHFGGPAQAKVGLVIAEVRDFSIQHGTFEAEFFLSLTSDKPMPELSLAFPNGHDINFTVLADTPTFKFYRYSGKFTTTIDLRRYPFDTQELLIQMEDRVAGIDQLIFKPDPQRTSLDSNFRISGYGVGSLSARVTKHLYPPRFDRDDLYVSRYKFILAVDRFATAAAFSVYVPAIVIVLISLMGLFVPADDLGVRSNLNGTMLVAAVFFHYTLMQTLPATGYFTHADKLMVAVYGSLILHMLTTWLLFLLHSRHHDRLFQLFRNWGTVATLIIMLLGAFV